MAFSSPNIPPEILATLLNLVLFFIIPSWFPFSPGEGGLVGGLYGFSFSL